jgi:hypothetical protein
MNSEIKGVVPSDVDGASCPSRCSVAIYLVGGWVSTGPRANDCHFEVGYVTTDFAKASEKAKEFLDAVIMEASDGSDFIDWDQKTVK